MVNSTKHLERNGITFSETLPKNWKGGHTSQSILTRKGIAVLLKPDKDTTRRPMISIPH